MLSFFPRGVLDEILNLIQSVSEGFPSYSNENASAVSPERELIQERPYDTVFANRAS